MSRVRASVRSLALARPRQDFRPRRRLSQQSPILWILAAALVWVSLWGVRPIWSLIAGPHPVVLTLPLTYALSITGVLVGGCFLWRLATGLLGRSAALPAVLATGCLAFLSYGAQLSTSNTWLAAFVYAAAWFFYRAVRTDGSSYWMLLGVTCAAGLLTTWQFTLILATFASIAIQLRLYRRSSLMRGAAFALGAAAVVLVPYVCWRIASHLPVFAHASAMMPEHLGAAGRMSAVGRFLLPQVAGVLVSMLVLALAAWPSWREKQRTPQANVMDFPGANRDRAWVLTLGCAPLGLLLLVGLVAGVRLDSAMGTTALQFVVLPVIYGMRGRRVLPAAGPLLVAFFVAQAVEAVYAMSARDTALGDRFRCMPRTVEDHFGAAVDGASRESSAACCFCRQIGWHHESSSANM